MTHTIAKAYVDRCRDELRAQASRMKHPLASEALDLALHQSISILLHGRLRQLRTHDMSNRFLPSDLHTLVGHWKASVSTEQLATIVQLFASQWTSFISELLRRLEADWFELASFFNLDPRVRLTGVSAPLGDSHSDGRSVARVMFDDGSSVIYKPRHVLAEFAFSRTLMWLRTEGMEPTLRACPVLAKDGYGWQQYQASAFCESTDEADRFYERQGAFLALFYFLCGSDGIAGNFIICRDHPIWVDTECMFVPNLPQRSTASYIPLWIRESVLTTGFIFWGNTMGVQPRAHSALSASCLEDRSHVFGIDDVLNSRYVDAVKRGFVNSYDWILSRRDAWSSDRAPLNWWLGQWNRVIPHPTSVYSVLSDALLVAPVDMKAQARRAVIEILRRSTSNACCWPSDLVHADLMALERGDIPIWWTSPLRRDLYGPSGQVARDIISRTGLERMRFRLGRLSPGDRDSQLWLTDTHLRINVVV